jgi:hypothetical protein
VRRSRRRLRWLLAHTMGADGMFERRRAELAAMMEVGATGSVTDDAVVDSYQRQVGEDVSTPCAVVPPPGLCGVVGTGVLWDVSTLCTSSWTIWGGGHRCVVGCQYTVHLLLDYVGWWAPVCCGMSVHCAPPPGLCGVVGTGVL